MAQVILISGKLEELPVKNIQQVGEEGAQHGQAVLSDGREIPIYNHPEDGTIWYEQKPLVRPFDVYLKTLQTLRAGGQVPEGEKAQGQALAECPYCGQMHQADQIEYCPLKP